MPARMKKGNLRCLRLTHIVNCDTLRVSINTMTGKSRRRMEPENCRAVRGSFRKVLNWPLSSLLKNSGLQADFV